MAKERKKHTEEFEPEAGRMLRNRGERTVAQVADAFVDRGKQVDVRQNALRVERGAFAPNKRVTVHDFKSDPMYPRLVRAVAAILAGGKVVAPVDVLMKMGILSAKDLEDWRFGRVTYLERVIQGNLTRLSRLLRLLGFHCHDLNLVAAATVYVQYGKGPRRPLRFTKTGEAKLERVYSRHFVWPGKGPFHPPREAASAGVPCEIYVVDPMPRRGGSGGRKS
jgi:hypothetical protein